MFTQTTRLRLLTLLLRCGGTLLVTAFAAMLLPVDWMAATHAWLGLGAFPRTPVVDYLARTVSALYGFHGILLFLIARDPVTYRSLVRYLVFMNVTLGLMVIAVDVHAGLPLPWILAEGPSLIVVGVLLWLLNR